jgi:hypothetical protein
MIIYNHSRKQCNNTKEEITMKIWGSKVEEYKEVCRAIAQNEEKAPDVFAILSDDEAEEDVKRRNELTELFAQAREIRSFLDGYRAAKADEKDMDFFNHSWDLLEDIKHNRI